MSAYPSFSTQVIGQAEKTLNAILDRQLAGTGLTEPQWVTLTVTAASDGTLSRDQLAGRIAGALKLGDAQARAHIAELAAAGLLGGGDRAASPVRLTEAGQQLHGRIRAAITEITKRLWGDLPPEDLATAGRVLGIVTERANAELSGS
jgi:DNA-binding MarR family transcriptional regulator